MSACGSDDDTAGPTTSTDSGTTTPADPKLVEYCAKLVEYQAATLKVDEANAQASVAAFAEVAAAARAAADVAPPEIEGPQTIVAEFTEELAAGFKREDPQTPDELKQASAVVNQAVAEKFGDLEQENSQILGFANRACTNI